MVLTGQPLQRTDFPRSAYYSLLTAHCFPTFFPTAQKRSHPPIRASNCGDLAKGAHCRQHCYSDLQRPSPNKLKRILTYLPRHFADCLPNYRSLPALIAFAQQIAGLLMQAQDDAPSFQLRFLNLQALERESREHFTRKAAHSCLLGSSCLICHHCGCLFRLQMTNYCSINSQIAMCDQPFVLCLENQQQVVSAIMEGTFGGDLTLQDYPPKVAHLARVRTVYYNLPLSATMSIIVISCLCL